MAAAEADWTTFLKKICASRVPSNLSCTLKKSNGPWLWGVKYWPLFHPPTHNTQAEAGLWLPVDLSCPRQRIHPGQLKVLQAD